MFTALRRKVVGLIGYPVMPRVVGFTTNLVGLGAYQCIFHHYTGPGDGWTWYPVYEAELESGHHVCSTCKLEKPIGKGSRFN